MIRKKILDVYGPNFMTILIDDCGSKFVFSLTLVDVYEPNVFD
jgi:hypothetical protein